MDLGQALQILRELERDMPRAFGHAQALVSHLHGVKKGVASVQGSGINPEGLAQIQGLLSKALEDLGRVQAALPAIGQSIKAQLP